MLDPHEFAEVLRAGVLRSGLANGKSPAEAGYVSLAGSILEYLKTHLEVTVPAGSLRAPSDDDDGSPAVKCRVS